MSSSSSNSTGGLLPLGNAQVAAQFNEVADLLEAHGANPFRIRAYQSAAGRLLALKRPVYDILEAEGINGLLQLGGIGHSLARSIEQLANTGHFRLLERLRGEPAEHLMATVAGIGRELASRIHETLGIETLEELEASAYDGRLAGVPGMGRKRVRAVCESLAGRFRRRPRIPEAAPPPPSSDQAAVAELLDVDIEYRRKVKAGVLPRIAPRRFNPTGEAWLPVLHTVRGSRHYTALYSNTARAHELGTTHDWVVLYRDDRDGDGQWTIVTSQYGQLRGHRIVRGREDECLAHYRSRSLQGQQASCYGRAVLRARTPRRPRPSRSP